jgi:hypothetical protein
MSLSLLKIAGKTDLSPVGVALVNKVSAAIGTLYKPFGAIADAWSEVQAGKLKAVGEIEIQASQRRAVERLLCETMMEQKHLESIFGKTCALLESDPDADAETIGQMDNDRVVFHSVRARRVSDDDMQSVWAKIFAEEAKKPGSFSKRTMAFIETLETWIENLATGVVEKMGLVLESYQAKLKRRRLQESALVEGRTESGRGTNSGLFQLQLAPRV